MTIEDVTIATETFTLLTLDHLHFLHQKGFLEIIIVKVKVIRMPFVFHCSSKYILLAIIHNDKLQVSPCPLNFND